MALVAATILFIISFFIIVYVVGIKFWVDKKPKLVVSLYIGTILIVWWAGHYFHQIPGIPKGDLIWHQRYMIMMLTAGPLSILMSGIVGYRRYMKKYMEDNHAN